MPSDEAFDPELFGDMIVAADGKEETVKGQVEEALNPTPPKYEPEPLDEEERSLVAYSLEHPEVYEGLGLPRNSYEEAAHREIMARRRDVQEAASVMDRAAKAIDEREKARAVAERVADAHRVVNDIENDDPEAELVESALRLAHEIGFNDKRLGQFVDEVTELLPGSEIAIKTAIVNAAEEQAHQAQQHQALGQMVRGAKVQAEARELQGAVNAAAASEIEAIRRAHSAEDFNTIMETMVELQQRSGITRSGSPEEARDVVRQFYRIAREGAVAAAKSAFTAAIVNSDVSVRSALRNGGQNPRVPPDPFAHIRTERMVPPGPPLSADDIVFTEGDGPEMADFRKQLRHHEAEHLAHREKVLRQRHDPMKRGVV